MRASKRMEVRRRLSRSLGAEESGYFHRESDISMSVLKRKVYSYRCAVERKTSRDRIPARRLYLY